MKAVEGLLKDEERCKVVIDKKDQQLEHMSLMLSKKACLPTEWPENRSTSCVATGNCKPCRQSAISRCSIIGDHASKCAKQQEATRAASANAITAAAVVAGDAKSLSSWSPATHNLAHLARGL